MRYDVLVAFLASRDTWRSLLTPQWSLQGSLLRLASPPLSKSVMCHKILVSFLLRIFILQVRLKVQESVSFASLIDDIHLRFINGWKLSRETLISFPVFHRSSGVVF